MAEGNLLSVNQMAAVLEHTPGGLAVYRYDGERLLPLFHNSSFYEITGYSSEHIKSTQVETSFLGVHPADIDSLRGKLSILLARDGGEEHTYRLWNDLKGEYRWIRMKCSACSEGDGTKLLYCIYDDVTRQKQLEDELTTANENMEDIINAIPGGVAIYKVTDMFETVYFSDGVPELSGYTVEEYRELVKQDAADMIYREDRDMVVSNAGEVVLNRGMKEFEFRKQHRDGHVVWVNVHVSGWGRRTAVPCCTAYFITFPSLSRLSWRWTAW